MKNLTFSKVSLGLTALALLAVFGLAGCGGGGGGGNAGTTETTSTTETTNSVPQIISVPESYAKENVAYTYQVSAIDADNDTLTYSLTTAPSGMTINSSTGLISWTPTSSHGGQQSAVVSVSDSKDSATQTYNVQVETATVAATQSISASTGGTVAVTDPTSPIYGAKISIPAGTLTSDAVVSIAQHTNASYVPEGAIVVGFKISGQSVSASTSLRTKNKARASETTQTACQIDIPYSQSFIDTYGLQENSEQLLLYARDATKNVWKKATDVTITAVDATANFVIAEVNGATEEIEYLYDGIEYLYTVGNTALINLEQSNTLSHVEKGTANDFWNNNGTNLLIIHGIGSSEESFAAPDYPNDFIEYFKANGDYANILFYNYPSGEYIEGNASWLAAEILRNNKNVKFDVIAHSMGGLVARWLNEQWILKYPTNFSNNIERLVMVGTPNFGSSAATWADFALVSLSIGKLKVPSLDELETGSDFLNTINSGNSVQKGSALYYWYTGNDGDSYLDGCAESDGVVCVPTSDNISYLGLDSTTAKTFGPTGTDPPYEHSKLHEKCATNGICDEIRNALTATSSTSQYTLTVSKSGTGSGTVTSSTGGISCGSTCSASYNSGTSVTLTASASSGSTFAGWSGGGCSGNSGTGTCIVTMNAATTVTATFNLTTSTAPSVSSFSINNGASSSTSRTVTLNNTATGSPTHYMASESSTFSGASWQTYSTAPSFTLSSGNATKTVYFKVKNSTGESAVVSDSITLNEATTTQYTLTISKSGTGSGTVTSSTGGISCGSTCSASYSSGTSVTLTASASSGSTFAGWSGGGCSGTGTCTVTMNAATTVTATFNTSSDTTPPTGAISINSGAAYTTSTSATLSISASDSSSVSQMCISNSSSCSSWETYTTSKSWTLTSGDGTKTVYIWFKDSVGNSNTSYYSDSITLDATLPSGTFSATGGSGQVSLSWSITDATSGIGNYTLVYSTGGTPSSCSSGTQIYSGTGTSYTHTGLTGGTTYYYRVCATDNAGNSSAATNSATPTTSTTSTVTVTGISPTTFSSSSTPYSPVITVSGTSLDQITSVTYSWTGPSSGSANGAWASSGTTSRTLNPTVLTNGDPSGTWTWTVYFYNSAGSQIASKTFTVTYSPATTQVERITNFSFSSGTSGWTLSGDFWAGTNLTRYYTSPGYASGGVDSAGSTKINASGSMYQAVTIPSTATSATLTFWLNITSDEGTTTTQYDKLFVEVLNSSGSVLATLATYSNLDKGSACGTTCTYNQKSFSLTSYKGQAIRIQFRATTDSASDTVFRIDDVSLMADGN